MSDAGRTWAETLEHGVQGQYIDPRLKQDPADMSEVDRVLLQQRSNIQCSVEGDPTILTWINYLGHNISTRAGERHVDGLDAVADVPDGCPLRLPAEETRPLAATRRIEKFAACLTCRHATIVEQTSFED